MFTLPNIPKEWLVLALLLVMIVLSIMQIDSWTHAIIGSIAGYILGKDIERSRNETL